MIKLQVWKPAALLKRDSNIGEICEIFKNTYFEEHPRMTASGNKQNWNESESNIIRYPALH